MKCKNCGWDNPDGYAKCMKCNTSMSDYIVNVRGPLYGYDEDDNESFSRSTVAGASVDDFNPHATIAGCAACGYPVRVTDAECPECGATLPVNLKEQVMKRQPKKELAHGGTIIHGTDFSKEKADRERKKLTGFLVTYSLSPNGQFYPLYEGKNMIGRSASCHVHIQGDESISEKHCSILYRAYDGKFKFKDEQSSNGTFINGELHDEGELQNTDMIRIGSTELLFMEIKIKN